ncbi:hypothetical protein KUF71_025984 [Frankliniella fusca]|uniref:Uncharacterized protein n=1 Tax=Frankliniella fusca TaxID=407009 RepID=A0AAE1H906_9NEOP|nr:hypothetical protein KUF71_025984 [Frankliniella fusca]
MSTRTRRTLKKLYTNTDVFHRLLVSSDPVISSLRRSNRTSKRKQKLSDSVLGLLTDSKASNFDKDSESDSDVSE